MQQVINTIPANFGTDPFFSIDAEGRIIGLNGAASKFVPPHSNNLNGTKFSSLFIKPNHVEKALSDVLAKGSIEKIPLVIKNKQGNIPVLLHAFCVTDQQGEVNIYAIANTDNGYVQPFLNEKEERQKEQLLFASIINSSSDAILSLTLDGIINSWNLGAQKIFQYTAEEIIGQPVYLLIPPHLQYEEKEIQEKILDGKTIQHYETERVRKDGTSVNISLTISPIIDMAGNITGSSKIAKDISERKIGEDNLKKTLKEISDYKYALDESSILAITDQKGIIQSVNDNFCKISKYSREELVGQDHRIINSGHHSKDFIRELWTIIANGQIWRGELKNKAKDGTIYWVDTTIVPFLNEQGKPYQYVAIRADITNRKNAEEELKQSNASLEKAEEQGGLGSWQIDVATQQGKWSKQMFRFFGLEITEAAPAFEEFLQRVHPDDRAYLQQAMLDNVEGRIPVTKIYRTNPAILPLRYLLPSWQTTSNSNGKQVMFEGTLLDVTELKIAEHKIRASEKIYKVIASSIPDSVICLLDREYRYLLIEGDMLEKLGYSKANLLGQKAKDALSAQTFNEVEKDFIKAFNGEIVTKESNRLGYDIIARFIPLKDESNEVYAIMTVAIDITRLKVAQRSITDLNQRLEEKIIERTDELKKTNEELEAFSYSVSHDLRAPLRAVDGYAGMLAEDYGKNLDQEGKRLLNEIHKNARRMGLLIDDLLNFSRLGRKEVERSVIDMNNLVDFALWEIKQAGDYHAVIKRGKLEPIAADYTLMQNVMINLLSNAIKYSSKKEQPVVEISSEIVNKEVIYCISDNGVGFEMEYFHKLFGVFERLHSNDEFSGTGVGLAIAKRIIEKHHGKVWATGEIGQGASFYFSLPL